MSDELLREPVEDLRLEGTTTLAGLLDQFSRTGGFVAAKLATAARILRAMRDDPDCTRFLSFPAALMATGTRGVLRDLVKGGHVDVLVTTCGTLDHDLARVLADYYQGVFELDDAALREQGINRLGNVLVPDTSYGLALEGFLQPLLEQLYQERKLAGTDEGGASSSPSTQRWTGVSLIREVGLRLPALLGRERAEQTLLHWAAQRQVPIFVPGLSDGAFGSQLWQFYQTHKDFNLDVLAEEHLLSDIVFEARTSGALMVGGGYLQASYHLVEPVPRRSGLRHPAHHGPRMGWLALRGPHPRGRQLGQGAPPGPAHHRGGRRFRAPASFGRGPPVNPLPTFPCGRFPAPGSPGSASRRPGSKGF